MSEVFLDPGKQFQLRQMWAQETWTNSSRVQVDLKAQNYRLSAGRTERSEKKGSATLPWSA